MNHRFPTRTTARGRCAARGFTLIELMVVLVVLVVVAALAGPAMRTFMAQQRARNAAYELMADLIFARSEAVKRNDVVTVQGDASGWHGGWSVIANDGTTLRTHIALDPALAMSAGTAAKVDFFRDGRAAPTVIFTVTDAGGSTPIGTRCVRVQTSGLPKATLSDSGSCT